VSRVLVVGDIVTDVVAVHSGPLSADSDTPARVAMTGGGAAANTAAWLAHAGAEVSLIGAVGADPAGRARVAELTAAGVDCSWVVTSPAAPTGTVIVLTDGRHRTMVTDRGANHELRPSHVDAALTAHPDAVHLHLSGYTLLDETSRSAGLRALSTFQGPTSVDAASAAPLRQVEDFLHWIHGTSLLLANLDEARVLTSTVDEPPEAVALALARFVPEVVVKLGSSGAVWAGDGEVRVVPARPATTVDTTGAGDAFAAGLLAARVAGAGLDAALAQAVRLGAQAVAVVGARPSARPSEPPA
jgi:sugar/nucleoside kinase (ribokinase family)